MVTIWIAIKTDDGLVSDNYYKEGLAISETLDRQLSAKEQGVRALARVYGAKNTVEVYPEAVQYNVEQLELLLIHPTKSGFDRRVVLNRQGGVFRGNLPALTAANWHLKVQPLGTDWVISGRINWPTVQQATLVP
ncbi:MAG: FixH family protein [Gammaproteobacteria bacterium]|nr:FixH family protein [Gammaproteobacteria bacterium]